MKMNALISEVKQSEDFEDNEFSIKSENMGLILDILRSKIYSHPIQSICREITCNARDANREVNNKNPIVITINDSNLTDGETELIIQDEGPGISEERMKNIFLNYGSSTKRDTNKQTGGFGLGAKTPFSYCDSFTIKTIVNGYEYIYITAIEDQKKGKMYLTSKILSTMRNGTSIIIPIKDGDLSKFKDAVYLATINWKIKPIYNNFNNTYKNEILLDEKDFCIVNNNDIHYSGFLIDGIFYKYDNFKHDTYYNNSEHNLLIKFNNGDLTLSANRENIQYNDITSKKINKKLEKVYNILNDIMINLLYNCKNNLEKYILINKFNSNETNNLSIYKSSFKTLNKELNIKNFNVKKIKCCKYRINYKKLETNIGNIDYIPKTIYIQDLKTVSKRRLNTIHETQDIFYMFEMFNKFDKYTYKKELLKLYKQAKELNINIVLFSNVPLKKLIHNPFNNKGEKTILTKQYEYGHYYSRKLFYEDNKIVNDLGTEIDKICYLPVEKLTELHNVDVNLIETIEKKYNLYVRIIKNKDILLFKKYKSFDKLVNKLIHDKDFINKYKRYLLIDFRLMDFNFPIKYKKLLSNYRKIYNIKYSYDNVFDSINVKMKSHKKSIDILNSKIKKINSKLLLINDNYTVNRVIKTNKKHIQQYINKFIK
jgi:Histidine kinase-, DNA gyrase B-, and HSP90-like ATPase